MSTVKKEEGKSVSAYIETRNLDDLASKTGNLYKSINVISARSNQMNAKLKEELHRKLEEFASATDNLEEVFENREQIEISRYYEKLPKTSITALNEFINDETYFRDKE
ncbi:MAG TPA: DNA-directed RNA polymerase subunit omega [Chitinophagales bacterium]|jgi:DNA-directed RNA polymerase subunit K/omega|nr:DNA-directed RNA polymerase subunit omega [Chitinophagales bacterium]HQV77690.1 DNA-directed RNA polymerase subunit omega [Chitinophagales bacterium]HQW78163.1 DNA-directed RNA polymerase subunit omega [Chitinophagales bacterium]HRB67595.1 DNA-directed RNA polymerase subunit omega [Chitinophagales bacterium]